MEIKKIKIGGNREEINRQTGEHTPNLINNVKRSDLIFTPELLVKKLFKGSNQEYNTWLIKNKLHPSQINYNDINQKQELIKKLKIYTLRLLNEAKTDSMFSNELGNIIITKWLDTFDTLENHVYDLSDFSKIEFIKISDSFKKNFTTNSPFAFLTIDDMNQQLKVIESHKVLLLLDKKLPMGNKRGTPPGEKPKKLYQNLFTTIGYKGRGELTEGLNHHRTNFKNFNFNLNIETRLLNKIIYNVLKYDKKQIQIAFMFGTYTKKLYFESDINGTERKEEELDALAIAEGATKAIEKELHKKRQGSIAVDKTSIEVKKRVQHPKINSIKEKEINYLSESKQQSNTKNIEPKSQEINKPISHTLENFEKEMFKKQKGYAELAKEKISEALTNREQYIKEFHSFLNKGMNVSDALSKFSERYANNPYIKGIIETSITGELQLQILKNKGIEELNHTINTLKKEVQELKKDLDIRETEVASLNQNTESMIVAHTKQLEEIEINISKLFEERTELIKYKNEQSEMIDELEKLITQYELTLKERDNEIYKLKETLLKNKKEYNSTFENKVQKIKQITNNIEKLRKDKIELNNSNKKQAELLDVIKFSLLDSNREVESLKSDKKLLFRKIENYDAEIKHYTRQIEQLKEENKLTLSTINLLKISNKQLESQLETLIKNRKILQDKNREQEKLNEELYKEKKLLKEELTKLKKNKNYSVDKK